jgi:ADP-dependent NAD(P)H-hydrate dehydratase
MIPEQPDASAVLPQLPARPQDAHKGTFGTVLVIGGCAHNSVRMVGAPALTALSALRSGVGLVQIAAPDRVLDAALLLCPSATGLVLPTASDGGLIPHEAAEVVDRGLSVADAVVVGPGLGSDHAIEGLVLRVLAQDLIPVIVDADALNALSRIHAPWTSVRAPCVLTPHPGEYKRLAAALQIKLDPTDPAQRAQAAELLAQRTGCVVVLKGQGTVVSDGHRHWVCTRGSPSLATAGTGDVLAGLLGGLAARCVPAHRPELAVLPESVRARMPVNPLRPLSLYDAARVAVDVHAVCGERWALQAGTDGGMLASELTELIAPELQARVQPTQSARSTS